MDIFIGRDGTYSTFNMCHIDQVEQQNKLNNLASVSDDQRQVYNIMSAENNSDAVNKFSL